MVPCPREKAKDSCSHSIRSLSGRITPELHRDTRGENLHGTVTYIQAGQITAVEITNRENINGFLTKGDEPRPPNG